MMKELTGLKCKAIAVEVPEGVEPVMGLIYGVRIIHFGTTKHLILPKGSWTILGRANEFTMTTISKMLPDNLNNENIQAYGFEEWQSYCTVNNLTNELILIEQI